MKVSMNIDTQKLEGFLDRSVIRIRRERASIVKAEARSIMKDSLQQVPKDTFTLALSAFLDIDKDGDVNFGYGDLDIVNPKSKALPKDYMIEVHEDLTKGHPNGGKAKFLEDPINAHIPAIESSFAAKVARALRRASQGG